ncbi:MAG: 50S ribosomal protein L23 [Proteobacteria bacterium]|jgi:large subunit ribosomal protein L23|nr:50S ribosomal protein L23 [Pseudomonadota bacterium]
MRNLDVIRRPIINEKSTLCRRYGNQYVFAVDLRANKQEISEAVSTLFNVKVESVNTLVMPGKDKRFGRHIGHVGKWKKAVVTLADGQSIDFFDKVDEAAETAEA